MPLFFELLPLNIKPETDIVRIMRKITSFLVLLVFCCSCPAFGKVYIDIDSPAFQKFTAAIPDFKNIGSNEDTENLSARFSDNLTEMLKITGFFRIIDKNAFLEDRNKAGITAGSIDFHDWSSIGAEFLVKGGFQCNGKDLTAEFRLFDVVEGKLLTARKYWGTQEEIKAMVLKFASEILLALTGERGVFETKIAFIGKKGKTSDIYVIDFNGSRLVRVTRNRSITLFPHWSQDGEKLSFTSYMRGNPDLYFIDISKRKIKRISNFKGLNLSGPWSPDGSKILLTLSKDGNEEIYVMDIEKRKLRRLTYDPAIDVSPTWSPDGKKIAFVSSRSGSPQVFIMNSDGSSVRRLTYEGNYNTSPCWSPNGKRIAYEGMTNGHFQIFSIDEAGGNFLQITFEKGGCEYPSWSPDGRYLVFSSRKNGKIRICIINSNGLNLRTLHEETGMDAICPSWSPRFNFY